MKDDKTHCDECLDQLDDFRRAMLPAETAQKVARHLKECASCAAELEAAEQLSNLLKSAAADAAPGDVYFQALREKVSHAILDDGSRKTKIIPVPRRTIRKSPNLYRWLPAAALVAFGIASFVITFKMWEPGAEPSRQIALNGVRKQVMAPAENTEARLAPLGESESATANPPAEGINEAKLAFDADKSLNKRADLAASEKPAPALPGQDNAGLAGELRDRKNVIAAAPANELARKAKNEPAEPTRLGTEVDEAKIAALPAVSKDAPVAGAKVDREIAALPQMQSAPDSNGRMAASRSASAFPAAPAGANQEGLSTPAPAAQARPASPRFADALGGAREASSASKLYFDAEDARLSDQYREAIALYERVIKAAGPGELAAKSQMRIGDIEFEHFSNKVAARAAYSACLEPKLSVFLDAETLQAIRIRMDSMAPPADRPTTASAQ